MIRAILTFFFISTAAYASVTVHCENDFDCELSPNVKSIHAASLLWRFQSYQEPKYDLEEVMKRGGKKSIANELPPVTITFYVEYYYGDEGRHTLLHKILNITHDSAGYHYQVKTNYFDHTKECQVCNVTKTWTRSSAPKELFMKIVNNKDAQDGIDITVDDGILIELPKDE